MIFGQVKMEIEKRAKRERAEGEMNGNKCTQTFSNKCAY